MLEDISCGMVIGTKQVLKAMQAGMLEYAYLAEDTDAFLKSKLKAAAYDYGVELRSFPTMRELGESCKIDVGAACVGIRKAASIH